MIDQKSGIVPRATIISVVATDAVMKPDPHKTSAVIPRCWSHESNGKHPARARVKTVIANNVEKLGTSVQERASQPSVSTMRTKIEQASPQSRAALLTFSNGRLNFNQSFETIRRPSSPVLKAPAFLDPQQTGAGAFFKRDEALPISRSCRILRAKS